MTTLIGSLTCARESRKRRVTEPPLQTPNKSGNITAVLKDKYESSGERVLLALFVFLLICALLRYILHH
jgi:hypothetical protein